MSACLIDKINDVLNKLNLYNNPDDTSDFLIIYFQFIQNAINNSELYLTPEDNKTLEKYIKSLNLQAMTPNESITRIITQGCTQKTITFFQTKAKTIQNFNLLDNYNKKIENYTPSKKATNKNSIIFILIFSFVSILILYFIYNMLTKKYSHIFSSVKKKILQ
ncbi:hypothetical protein AB837_00017 [bacterium AB1]|nr:hypothetical protein AB837_00017 [bacterium AB1]